VHLLVTWVQVPWHTQLWAGAIEVLVILAAMGLVSGPCPSWQESVQLLLYSLVMYCAPLACIGWQQHKEVVQPGHVRGQGGAHSVPEPAVMHPSGVPGVKAGPSKDSCVKKATSAADISGTSGTVNQASNLGSSASVDHAGPAGGHSHLKQGHEGGHSPRTTGLEERSKQEEVQQQVPGTRPPVGEASRALISLGQVAAAAGAPVSTLYQSPLQHSAMSVKVSSQPGKRPSWLMHSLLLVMLVCSFDKPSSTDGAKNTVAAFSRDVISGCQHQNTALCVLPREWLLQVYRPTGSYSNAAVALQQSFTQQLSAALPDNLMHISTACVRGCVHMFVWLAQLRGPLMADPADMTAPEDQSSEQASAADTEGTGSVQGGLSAVMTKSLLGATTTAGAGGPVDVQVTTQGPSHRYHLTTSAPAESTSAAPSPAQPIPDAASTPASPAASGLHLHSIHPPCLALPSTPAHPPLTAQLQLTTAVAQEVRLLVLAATTGALLVDAEHVTVAGDVTTIDLTIPAGSLAKAALSLPLGAEHDATHTSQPIIPLQIVITAPVHASDTDQPPPPARLHTTASLLAAPGPLASELCSVYTGLEVEGQGAGLTTAEVWSTHWQPLTHDVCLLGTLAARRRAGTLSCGSAAVAAQVAQSLSHFFADHALPAWQAQVSCFSTSLQQHEVSRGGQGEGSLTTSSPSVAPPYYSPDSFQHCRWQLSYTPKVHQGQCCVPPAPLYARLRPRVHLWPGGDCHCHHQRLYFRC
jgi:hypothetical protein